MNTETNQKLVGEQALLEILWPNEIDRPSVRWLRLQRAKRAIPFIKFGRFIWFNPEAVAAALAARATLPLPRL